MTVQDDKREKELIQLFQLEKPANASRNIPASYFNDWEPIIAFLSKMRSNLFFIPCFLFPIPCEELRVKKNQKTLYLTSMRIAILPTMLNLSWGKMGV